MRKGLIVKIIDKAKPFFYGKIGVVADANPQSVLVNFGPDSPYHPQWIERCFVTEYEDTTKEVIIRGVLNYIQNGMASITMGEGINVYKVWLPQQFVTAYRVASAPPNEKVRKMAREIAESYKAGSCVAMPTGSDRYPISYVICTGCQKIADASKVVYCSDERVLCSQCESKRAAAENNMEICAAKLVVEADKENLKARRTAQDTVDYKIPLILPDGKRAYYDQKGTVYLDGQPENLQTFIPQIGTEDNESCLIVSNNGKALCTRCQDLTSQPTFRGNAIICYQCNQYSLDAEKKKVVNAIVPEEDDESDDTDDEGDEMLRFFKGTP